MIMFCIIRTTTCKHLNHNFTFSQTSTRAWPLLSFSSLSLYIKNSAGSGLESATVSLFCYSKFSVPLPLWLVKL